MKTKKQLRYADSLWKDVKENEFIYQSENTSNAVKVSEQYFIKNSNFDNKEEAETAWKLALGRIFRMGSRPTQEGDVEMYEKCKDIIMDASEYLKNIA